MNDSLQAVLDKAVDGKKVFGTSFAIKKDDVLWHITVRKKIFIPLEP
jgi:lipoate-protein ligase A